MFNHKEERDGGGMFLRINDGEHADGVFFGDVKEFFKKWDGTKYYECSPREEGASFKWKCNFIIKENGKLVAKIFENGTKLNNQLASLVAAGYELPKTKVRISRSGKGANTTWSVTPIPNGHVDDATYAMLKDVELHSLSGEKKKDPKGDMLNQDYVVQASAQYTTDDIPF